MASGRDANSSDDDDLFLVLEKHKRRRINVVSSDSDDSDSDIEIRPKTRRRIKKIDESDSDSNGSNCSQQSTSALVRACFNGVETNSEQAENVSINDSSDSEQSEKCAICLNKFTGQEMATPEVCDHVFCSDCLKEWSKKVNTCPIDRKKFDVILIRKHGCLKDHIRVRVVSENPKCFSHDSDSDTTYCEMCGESDSEETLLVCDECELGFHCECLNPPLESVPVGRWYCPYCSPYIEIRERMIQDFHEIVATRFRPLSEELRRSIIHRSGTSSDVSMNLRLGDIGSNSRSVLVANGYFSSDSSDDDAELSTTTTTTTANNNMWQCCRNASMERWNRHSRNRVATPTPFETMNSLSSTHLIHPSEYFELSFDHGNIISSHRRPAQALTRTKELIPDSSRSSRSRTNIANALRSSPAASVDIVGEILEMQTLLHAPSSGVQRDGSHALTTSPVGQQCPLNPTQKTPSKCGSSDTSQPNSTFASSSSSSSGSTSSQCQELYNMPGCSMLENVNADGYDTDSLSMVTHRSYGSTSIPDELRKDSREVLHVRDSRKGHSDDEVDIYSDIELANDEETSLDTEMQTMSMNYKSDETHLPLANDGSDSSDNDLVIDEDAHAAEDDGSKNKHAAAIKTVSARENNEALEEGSNSGFAELDDERNSETNMPDSIQSPDELEDISHDSNLQIYNNLHDNFGKATMAKDSSEFESKVSLDSDVDSREINSTGNEADEENSMNSFQINAFRQKPDATENWDLGSSSSGEESEDRKQDCGNSLGQVTDHNVSSRSSFEQKEDSVPPIDEMEKGEEDDESSMDATHPEENSMESDQEMGGGDSPSKNDDTEGNMFSQSEHFSSVESSKENEMESELVEGTEDSNDKSLDVAFQEDNGDELNNCSDSHDADNFENSPDTPASGNAVGDIGENANEALELSGNSSCEKPYAVSENESQLMKQEDACSVSCTDGSRVVSGYKVAEEATDSPRNEDEPQDDSCNLTSQNIDLGIEDISDAASDDLNQADCSMDYDPYSTDANVSTLDNVERNVAQLFESCGNGAKSATNRNENDGALRDDYRYSSFRQSLIEDQEEGEIIEDVPCHKKDSRVEHYHEDVEEYMDSTPRINISDLPRIPKIKRDVKKSNVPEEPPLEVKRMSVLGRIDLGSSDISWKRLSQHTRERSYRDGRPKDESVLFREREPRSKDKKNKGNTDERSAEKLRDSDRSKRDESKKQDIGKSRDRSEHRDKKSEKSRDQDKKQDDWSYMSDKREKGRSGKSHKEKHDRDKSKKDRDKKKDRHNKDKSSRDGDKYDRDKYSKDVDRYESDDRYERVYEKSRDKDHKHKHKSDSSKKSKEEKRKRSHSKEHYVEKQKEREVRKVDDKLKIVVEHKESRKDKMEKYVEKKDSKHDKKHSVHYHHHECKKKEPMSSPYFEVTPIESKEIFAQGDSIIINVNFNRASPREILPSSNEESSCRERKQASSELSKSEHVEPNDDGRHTKSKHSSHDKENMSVDDLLGKRPVSPTERNSQHLQVGECYWQEGDDNSVKSPSIGKCSVDKICSDEDENTASPGDHYAGTDNLTDSDDNENLAETQLMKHQVQDESSATSTGEKQCSDGSLGEGKENDFSIGRRRSPQPPSPPSPPDNDSYDPCEPTRSPSPPAVPPLPSSMSDRPKPPPSPELPPLPPEPEPIDMLPHDDLRCLKSSAVCTVSEVPTSTVSSPLTSQQQEQSELYTQTTVESCATVPSTMLPPPPTFPPQVTPRTVHMNHSPLVPPKTASWNVSNAPSAIVFAPSHPQTMIRGNFLPSQFPTMGLPPPSVSATMLPPASTVPLMSQVRHLQMSTHGVMPANPLVTSVPIGHLSLTHMAVAHMNNPSPTTVQVHHHQLSSVPSHPNSHSASSGSHSGVHMLYNQSQASGVNASLQSQHGGVASGTDQNVVHLSSSSQNQVLPSPNVTSQKNDKLPKSSPVKEKSEVVDMDVDSPYSPGDSPSMDSNFDYSPPNSPLQKEPAVAAPASTSGPASKEVFDCLLDANRASGKASGKNRVSANCSDTPSKKIKVEAKSESSSKVRHAVRLQMSDRLKKKEQKLLEKMKMDDSQLKILDELPSSAVEMQVKEKFLKKLNRQERVVEEVKLALKPYYKTRDVSKEEYKDILRKSVPKICHNRSGEINPVKVKYLVECYVKKIKHAKKKAEKRHKSSKFS